MKEKKNKAIALVPSVPSPHINLVYQGESIKSLRTLLRRFSFSRTVVLPDMPPTDIWYGFNSVMSRRPLYPGYDPNGIYGAVGLTSGVNQRYNWAVFHPLLWVSQCFVADRGSINIRANFTGPVPNTSFSILRKNQGILTRSDYSAKNSTNIGKQNLSRNMTTALFGQFETAGTSITNGNTNASLSAALPLYSIYKFLSTSPYQRTLGNVWDNSTRDSVVLRTQFNPTYLAAQNIEYNNTMKIDLYYAAGTDYSPIFFLNVPMVFRYLSTPSSSETIP
jgi:hypothetical protein